MEKDVRILLVDDHQVVRDGLWHMLGNEEDMQLVGQGANAEEAISQIEKLSPDIVLMDIKMPGMDGIELTRHLVEKHPSCNIIMLTLYDEYLSQALEAGAKGYLLKDIKREELTQAIRQVHRGEVVISKSIASAPRIEYEERGGEKSGEDLLQECSGLAPVSEDLLQERRRAATVFEDLLRERRHAATAYEDLLRERRRSDAVFEEMELVVPPPADAGQLLRFVHQMKGVLEDRYASIAQIVGSWDCGTVIKMQIRNGSSADILDRLRNMPDVERVEEESAGVDPPFGTSKKFGVLPRSSSPNKRIRISLRETDISGQERTAA